VEPDDAELISRTLVERDPRAFDQLVLRYQSPVRSLLRRLTGGNEALADDLGQETFLIAWRKLGNFRNESRFSTWLHQIAYRTFLAHTRSRRDHEPLDDHSNPGSVDSTARGSDFQHDLEIAMLKLSESERAVVTLCLGSSLTHDEAANVLQLPIGTVKTHLLRGREKLRTQLAEWNS